MHEQAERGRGNEAEQNDGRHRRVDFFAGQAAADRKRATILAGDRGRHEPGVSRSEAPRKTTCKPAGQSIRTG